MKIDAGREPMDLGFEIHEKGWYVMQVGEGAKVLWGGEKEEPDDGCTLQLPLASVEALEGGSADAVGDKVTMFIYLLNKKGYEVKFGEKMLSKILTYTDLAPAFEERFEDGTPFTDPKFLDSVILKTQSKVFEAYVDHEPDYYDKDKKRAKITAIRPYERKSPKAPAGSGGDSWD